MKTIGFFGACLAVLPSLCVGQAMEDMNIRTWADTIMGMDIANNRYNDRFLRITPPAGYANDKIVSVKVLVYSDELPPEVFNLSRQTGINTRTGSPKTTYRSGGWSYIFATTPGTPDAFFLGFDSGDPANGNGFFHASFPFHPDRHFTNLSKVRCVLTIEYVCTQCGAQTTNTIWQKIGNWQMEQRFLKPSTFMDMSGYGVSSSNFVDMSATIQSDPDASGKIQVDDLEHVSGNRGWGYINTPHLRNRGGVLWYGHGCSYVADTDCKGSATDKLGLHLYSGPTMDHFGATNPPAATVYGLGKYTVSDASGNFTDVPVPYASSTVNRGWVRVEYTGAKSTTPIPYAMKTRVSTIGPWNMNQTNFVKVPFSPYGIAANRISRVVTTIRSDGSNCGPRCWPGYEYVNFHRPATQSGSFLNGSDPENLGGGVTFLNEAEGYFYLTQASEFNFFNNRNGYNTSVAGSNRGFVLVDYLAGSCDQGPTGFKIQAVPGIQVGDCSGNASSFTFVGGGGGRVNNVGSDISGTADDFTYMYKPGTWDVDVQVKIESQTAVSDTANSGIMIRSDMSVGARQASILFSRGRGVQLVSRSTMSGNTASQTCANCTRTSFTPPFYMRLVKTGTTFTGMARKLSTDTWTSLGSVIVGGFPTTYNFGLAESSHDKSLAQSVFSGLTNSTIPYYKIVNKNSGKVLDLSGPSGSNGGNIDQWGYNPNASQQYWQLVDLGGGYWKIVNKYSGLVLDVSGASTANGGNVQQWAWTGGTNQQWQITDLTTGWYKFTARHSSKALDVNGSSMADGANVQQWDWNSGANQQWQFVLP